MDDHGSERARLGRDVRRLIAGNTLSALGNGFTLPFLLIYLHEVRHLPLQTTALVIASVGVIGFAAVPFSGVLADRVGSRTVLIGSLLVATAGTLLLVTIHSTWQAFAVVGLLGAGESAMWPAQSALIARLVPAERRPRAYALQFALLNLGIGVGGAVSGLVVDVHHPGTFAVIYAVDAVTFLVYAVILLGLDPRPPPGEPRPDTDTGGGAVAGRRGGYRQVLADRTFLRVCGVTLLLTTMGYAQIESGLPAFATGVAHVSTRVIGLGFAANTALIVLAQLPVERRISGRRRSRALAGVALVWAASWVVFGTSALVSRTAAGVLVIVSMGLFGLGETLWSPIGASLVNELATDDLRGRYNAVGSLTWQLSSVLGPVVAGVLLSHGLNAAYIGMLVGTLLVVAGTAARLERHLTPEQNGIRPADLPTLELSALD